MLPTCRICNLFALGSEICPSKYVLRTRRYRLELVLRSYRAGGAMDEGCKDKLSRTVENRSPALVGGPWGSRVNTVSVLPYM